MILSNSRHQRRGRLTLWFVAALAVIFVSLLGYTYYRNREHSMSDPDLLRDLQEEQFHVADDQPRERGDWAQWRGPRRDGVALDTGLVTDWGEGPKVVWKQPASTGFSAVSIASGRACTILQDGDNEAVVCWDADTGKQLWHFAYPCKYENSNGSGPRSTPTMDGEHIYTVGATGIFHCLKAASGEQVWRHDLLDEFKAANLKWGVSFSPLVEGDLVLTNPGGPNGSSVVAFDKRSGQVVWKSLDDQAGYSSPIAVTVAGVRQLIFFTAPGLVGLSPRDGTVLWRYPWETSFECNIATPICVGDYIFISSGYGRGCCLVKVVPEGGSLKARRVYENNQMCNHFSSSVYYRDHLYGFNETTLTCMDFRTGKVLWKEKGFKKGSLLVADGQLIILGEYGQLALARATPDGFRQTASYQIPGGRSWTVPTLANGKLYVRNEEHVYCLELKQR